MEKTKLYWCLGKDVPVTITLEDGTTKEGTVTALDPRQMKGPYQQPKRLFLDGATIGKEPIESIVTEKGQDVTRHVKMSFGPGL
ncbi:hypothetical protein HY032_03505 [Candidatus Gottesmanbacteria bacterium]|nr:hypothetical protein [Candidatus Gottesmanbacteria bacterium]